MSTAVRISDSLMKDAKLYSAVENRSVIGQIEHWARIGKCAEANPDLTFRLIYDILVGMEEMDRCERSDYEFG